MTKRHLHDTSRSGEAWMYEEDSQVLDTGGKTYLMRALAVKLKRTPAAIRNRFYMLMHGQTLNDRRVAKSKHLLMKFYDFLRIHEKVLNKQTIQEFLKKEYNERDKI